MAMKEYQQLDGTIENDEDMSMENFSIDSANNKVPTLKKFTKITGSFRYLSYQGYIESVL
jgi:hypothetical protein